MWLGRELSNTGSGNLTVAVFLPRPPPRQESEENQCHFSVWKIAALYAHCWLEARSPKLRLLEGQSARVSFFTSSSVFCPFFQLPPKKRGIASPNKTKNRSTETCSGWIFCLALSWSHKPAAAGALECGRNSSFSFQASCLVGRAHGNTGRITSASGNVNFPFLVGKQATLAGARKKSSFYSTQLNFPLAAVFGLYYLMNTNEIRKFCPSH